MILVVSLRNKEFLKLESASMEMDDFQIKEILYMYTRVSDLKESTE